MDLFTPPPRKRKRIPTDSPPPPQRTRKTKKVKTGAVPTLSKAVPDKDLLSGIGSVAKAVLPGRKNAKAGPSKPRREVSGDTQSSGTRHSTRVSRPTPKKAAAQAESSRAKPSRVAKRSFVSSDSDSDSDRTPPLRILKVPNPNPKIPPHPKVTKIPTFFASKLTITGQKSKHLGALELTDSDDDNTTSRTLAKSATQLRMNSSPGDFIDLCSSDEGEKATPISSPIKKVIVLVSSEDEGQESLFLERKRQLDSRTRLDVHEAPVPDSPCETLASSPRQCPDTEMRPTSTPSKDDATNGDSSSVDIVEEVSRPTKRLRREHEEPLAPGALQAHCAESLERWRRKPARARARSHNSSLSTPTYKRPVRDITFSDELPTLDLHTPLFFSQCLSSIKASMRAAQKRAKKRRARLDSALPAPVITNTTDIVSPVEASAVSGFLPVVSPTIPLSHASNDILSEQASEPIVTSLDNLITESIIGGGPIEIPKDVLTSAHSYTDFIQSLRLAKKLDEPSKQNVPPAHSPDSPTTSSSEIEYFIDDGIMESDRDPSLDTTISPIEDLCAPSIAKPFILEESGEISGPPSSSPSDPRPVEIEDDTFPGADRGSPAPAPSHHAIGQSISTPTFQYLKTQVLNLDAHSHGFPIISNDGQDDNDSDDSDDISLSALELVYPDETS